MCKNLFVRVKRDYKQDEIMMKERVHNSGPKHWSFERLLIVARTYLMRRLVLAKSELQKALQRLSVASSVAQDVENSLTFMRYFPSAVSP